MDLGVCVAVHCGSPRWLNSKTSKCLKAERRQQITTETRLQESLPLIIALSRELLRQVGGRKRLHFERILHDPPLLVDRNMRAQDP